MYYNIRNPNNNNKYLTCLRTVLFFTSLSFTFFFYTKNNETSYFSCMEEYEVDS